MGQTLVTIVVPIYKVENFLSRCLDSIIAQHYRPLEVILVNDGSPDDCQRVIDRYVANYPDLFIAVRQENQGLGPARNAGMALATGEWLGFIDSDDYVEPDYISAMVELAEAKGVDIVVCNFYLESPTGKRFPFPLMTQARELSGERAAKQSLNLLTVPNFAWNKLCRTSLFRDNHIQFPAINYEDVAITVPLLVRAGKVAILQKPYYHYCQRDSSIVGHFNERNVHDYLLAVELVADFLLENQLLPEWNGAWKRFLRHVRMQLTLQSWLQIIELPVSRRFRLVREARGSLNRIRREAASALEARSK